MKLKSRDLLGRISIIATGLVLAPSTFASSLSLDEYLSQVKTNHTGYQAASNAREGAMTRSREGELLLSPQAFINAQKTSDAKATANPSFQGDKTLFDSYSLGVSKLTSFGLQGKLSYNVNYTELIGANPTFVAVPQFYDARPQLELTQSLWRNGFGKETNLTIEAQEAQTRATAFSESYKGKLVLQEAETVYWRLALARDTVKVQKESLARFEKIASWIEGRVKQDLSDRADLYQAQAALEARQLELRAASDEERAAARAFNSSIGVASETVEAELVVPNPETFAKLALSEKVPVRDDVKAAEQAQKAAIANGKLAIEKSYPTLDLVGSLALNARDPSVGTSTGNSFKTDRPTWAVGVRFTTGLNISLASDIRDGIVKEQSAAELNYRRRVFEQEREWNDLTQKLGDVRRRLELSLQIEKAQERKLAFEKVRHRRGRSNTYQVLLFEQDFANAQLARIRTNAEILQIIARLKTFEGAI